MNRPRFQPPAPRAPLADPTLVRPNHFTSQLRPEGVLWLDRGECIDPQLTDLAASILKELPRHAIMAYPAPGPLYRKLAGHLGIGVDRLRLTRGTDGAIRTVFETYVDPGDLVLVSDPTYQMYGVYAQMFGARLAKVPYRMVDGRPVLTGAEVVEGIHRHRPKLVGLPYPDNPTGFAFTEDEMRAIVEAAGEVGALMLADEAYHPFHPHSCLPWVEEYGHLVVARSFSKAWGMAGIRLGYTAAAPEVTAFLHKVRPMVEADGLSMALAERMLDHGDAVKASLERLVRGRGFFSAEMKALGFHALDTPCNFVHVKFGDKRAAVEEALKDVARFRLFPDSILKDFLRFTTTTTELFGPVVDAIRDATR
jgi:histidinol-phosphate aminotransferase